MIFRSHFRVLVVVVAFVLAFQAAVLASPPPKVVVPSGTVTPAGALTDLVIVIDAGHGLKNGIATGACRTYNNIQYCEDDMNFQMARGAAAYFASNYPDTQVILSRTTGNDSIDWNGDGTVNNTDRWYLANNLWSTSVVNLLGYTPKKIKADLYMSFHMNTNSNTALSGTICYQSTQGTAANWSQKSDQFCQEVVAATVNSYNTKDNPPTTYIKNGSYFDNLNMPHTIVEAGFVSNQTDAIHFANNTNAFNFGQWAGYGAMNMWYFEMP